MSSFLFQNALKNVSQKCPPIWFMRQAGRYHKHYQNLRSKHSFDELCKRPELAAEVAFGPVIEFDFDVAILFSDILYPLEALGMGLEYTDKGPQLGFLLNNQTISKLHPAKEVRDFLNFQGDAVKLTRAGLPSNKSLIGFVGGPWTLFVYAIEGTHKTNLTQTKMSKELWLQFQKEIEILLEWTIQRQLEAGAEVVMLFDTAAGDLSPALFHNWVLPSLKKFAELFPHRLGYYSKGTTSHHYSKELLSLPWAGVGIDHRFSLSQAFSEIKSKSHQRRFIQGNFDQSLLLCDRFTLERHLNDYLMELIKLSDLERCGWVCGLGHGVLPGTPEDHVKLFIDTVREVFS